MTNKLEQLKTMTTVVADTGDIDGIEQFRPVDATTNPSLLYKAAQMPRYQHLVEESVREVTSSGFDSQAQVVQVAEELAVRFGREILAIVPGKVSTEIDARLSFDTKATIENGKRLLETYHRQGVDPARVLLKIASTWEGIKAAEKLERDGIHCNLTLLFGFNQAVAAADAGAYLISPFVGRILDWYKASTGQSSFTAEEDPGVRSVVRIYDYYKQHGYDTVVMGASFRNVEEIEALAGCDRLTISPQFLQELTDNDGEMVRRLSPDGGHESQERESYDEPSFRYALNDDAMATEKLAEGIRNFVADQERLESSIRSLTL